MENCEKCMELRKRRYEFGRLLNEWGINVENKWFEEHCICKDDLNIKLIDSNYEDYWRIK